MESASQRGLWRRLTPRILISTALAATLSVAAAAGLWTRFFMNEVRLQVAQYTEDVVPENVARCAIAPETFGRRREIGSFDAYDAATLRSANPTAAPPDPVLVRRLRAGERVPARVDWSWSGALGGAAMMRVARGGPCSLFELRWYAPPGARSHLVILVFAMATLTLTGAVALSSVLVVRPLVRRLSHLCAAAEHVGEASGYQPGQDQERDDIGELSRILDRAHQRIRAESSRLRSRRRVLLAHLEDVAHDLRTPLTAVQIAIERASGMTDGVGSPHLIRSALADVVYTSELTENLRLAVHLEEEGDPREPAASDLTAVVERAMGRLSLLGRHMGIDVDFTTPGVPLFAGSPLIWAERAVANLVHAAVSRAREGGHVAVLLEAEDAAFFRLTVLDDGSAAASTRIDDLAAWTSRPERARPRDEPGGGLALALTGEICRRNRWRIDLEPQDPCGLRATIRGDTLAAPADAADGRDSAPTPVGPAEGRDTAATTADGEGLGTEEVADTDRRPSSGASGRRVFSDRAATRDEAPGGATEGRESTATRVGPAQALDTEAAPAGAEGRGAEAFADTDRLPSSGASGRRVFSDRAAARNEAPDRQTAPSLFPPEPSTPLDPHRWRQITPRLMLSGGLAAVASTLLIGAVLTHFMVQRILDGVGRYAESVAADNVAPCLLSPETWSRVRHVGRLDAYDAATLRSRNPASPPLDEALRRRVLAGERSPSRLFLEWDGQWGGAMLRRVAAAGPCSLFQLGWRAAPGSRARGLALLITLTLATIGLTMAFSSMAVVRPLLARLSRLRRAAAVLGSADEYRPGSDDDDDEIGRLSRILDRTHQRVLEESRELRERLKQLERNLDDVGHDFRTPLSSAQISLELAARLAPGPEARDAIRRALTDIVYAGNVAQNLRLLTQLRQESESADPDAMTELTEVVERVVARFSLLGRHGGVKVEGAAPRGELLAQGHPVWAEQALANVVHNAVTHGGPGTNVAVILETAGGERFRISVADDGPGVAARDLGRIAKRAFRSSGAWRRHPGGRGLGLAITTEICRRNEWTLRFEPQEPRGLRVTIEGPLVGSSEARRSMHRWLRQGEASGPAPGGLSR